jgi:hypothetical protein
VDRFTTHALVPSAPGLLGADSKYSYPCKLPRCGATTANQSGFSATGTERHDLSLDDLWQPPQRSGSSPMTLRCCPPSDFPSSLSSFRMSSSSSIRGPSTPDLILDAFVRPFRIDLSSLRKTIRSQPCHYLMRETAPQYLPTLQTHSYSHKHCTRVSTFRRFPCYWTPRGTARVHRLHSTLSFIFSPRL